MTAKDQSEWDRFKKANFAGAEDAEQDRWARQIVSFTETWAEMMEARVLQGTPVSGCAECTSFEADGKFTDGLTMLMYQAAVRMLGVFWVFGDDLVAWHNDRFNIDERNIVPSRSLVDCAAVSTPMGRAALIAPYATVMKEPGRYTQLCNLAYAQLVLNEMATFYAERLRADEGDETAGVCPNCRKTLNACFQTGGGDSKPEVDELTLCGYCAAILRFQRNDILSIVPLDELKQLAGENPDDLVKLGGAWVIIRDRALQRIQ